MAIQTVSNSTVPGILKELYTGQKVQKLNYENNVLFGMIKKETEFGGKYWPMPVQTGLSQGASATFGSAYSYQTAPIISEFLINRVEDFSLFSLDGQLLECATSNPEAFISAVELAVDAAWQTAVNRLASAMFRNGAGTLAQMSGNVVNVSGTTYTITLANPDDNVQFEIGMNLNCTSLADGSGGVANSNLFTVSSVNRNTGVLTGTILTASTGWAANYYLAQVGDLPNASNPNFPISGATTNSQIKIAGLASWLPLAGPQSGDSFFGVNRTIDPVRLAGVVVDGSALSIEEALQKCSAKIAMQGGKPDVVFMSFASYNALSISLGSKIQYIEESLGEIGFQGIQVNGANSVLHVYADRYCPDGLAYVLTLDDWVLRSQKEAPHILRYLDQIEILRNQDTNSCTGRIGTYANMYCKKPGHSGVVTIQLQEF